MRLGEYQFAKFVTLATVKNAPVRVYHSATSSLPPGEIEELGTLQIECW
jgi:hypothetical protein